MAKLQYNKWKSTYRVLNDDGTSKTFTSESQARNYLGKLDKDIEAKKPTWEQKGFMEQFDSMDAETQNEYLDKLSAKDFMKLNIFNKKTERAEGRAQYKKFREEDSKYSSTARKERLLTETPPEEIERLRIKKIADAKYKKDGPPLSPEQEARLAGHDMDFKVVRDKRKKDIEAFTDPSRRKEVQLRRAPIWHKINDVESKGNIPKPRNKIIRPKTSKGPQKVMINGKWLTADEASMKLLKQKRGY